ncbi:MAG: hypothetical protein ACTSRU_04800 [Candidatus Hodarchaeales archaeon]
MAEKLTLKNTWRMCIEMWRYVSKRSIPGKNDVENLKKEWLKTRYQGKYSCIGNGCFFCEYGLRSWKNRKSTCLNCPGFLVDESFNCMCDDYNYGNEPVKFYKKILELHSKFKDKK